MDEWTDLDQAYLEIFDEHPGLPAELVWMRAWEARCAHFIRFRSGSRPSNNPVWPDAECAPRGTANRTG